jgi:PncC family amidohydrolase
LTRSGALVERVAGALRQRHLSVAVAESCTAGLLAAALTDPPGASVYLLGGVVAYANEVKRRLLDVPPELLERHGAVSRECAEAMARGARGLFAADLGVSVTGIAGPAAEGDKPVGLTFVAVAFGERLEAREHRWNGDRAANRAASVEAALDLMAEVLS